MKPHISSLLIAFLLIFHPAPGNTAETLNYAIFPAPPFMIGAERDDGPVSGIDVDIVRKIAEKSGLDIEFIRCPWARCLKMMESGEVDLLSSAYKTPDRQAFMQYFDRPFLSSLPIAFYFKNGSNHRIAAYEDLYGIKSIGVLRGAGYFPRFDQDARISKIEVATQDLLIPMLLEGRFTAMAGYVPTENYRIATEGYAGQIKKSAYEFREPADVYMAVSKKSPLINRFAEMNAANSELAEQGLIEKIVESYYRRYSP